MNSSSAPPFSHDERLYQTIVHSLDGIVWAADPKTFQFTFVSDQAERLLGYPLREWLDDAEFWVRHTHPDDVAWCVEFCRDATSHGRDHTFDYRMVAADGRVVWLRDVVTVRVEPDGSSRLVGIMLDITAQKESEAARRQADELYRCLAENMSEVITVYDLDANRVYCSPSYVRTLGCEPQPAFVGIHPDDLARGRDAFERIRRGESVSITYRHQHADGSWRWLDARGCQIEYNGRPHILAVTRDVTDLKGLEDQLRHAQKMEAVGVLAGGIAHDFNNLLTVIRGYVELLPPTPSDPDDQPIGDEIRRACDRAVILTQQLLAFSRKQVLHPKILDLNETLKDLVSMVGKIVGESIALKVDLAATLPPVLADPAQVQQVIINLAMNARDAMALRGTLTIETGAVDIPASASKELAAGRYATIAITDSGAGIAPDVLPRIFEPFFTTKEPGRGTGLGLSTAYGIMKQSRGHIDVRSTIGAGTTFTLYFPESTVTAPVQERTAPAPGTETVLLVEDEEQVRRLAVRALERNGYRVRTASSGPEALELFRDSHESFALLITDVVMPGMTGPELVERLEAIRPGLRVVYMSGYPGEAVLQRGVSELGVGFVQKPFTVPELLMTVRHVLDAQSRA